MKFFLSLLLVFSLSPKKDFRKSLSNGINKLYQLKLDEADKLFNTVIQLAPNDPRGYYYKSLEHLWTFLGSKQNQEYDSFFVYSDKAKLLVDSIDSIDQKVYLSDFWKGNVYSQRAMAFSANGSMIDAFWATKKAVGNYEDALEANPDFYDAYLGIGLFEYALSFVPAIFKWGLTITGLTADKEEGFKKIRLAQRKGNFVKVEATYHLSKLYMDYVAEYDSAKILLKQILAKYPENTLFLYQYALTLIANKELNKGEDVLNKLLQIDNKYLTQTNAFSYFLLGEIYFKRNKFEKAKTYYLTFLKHAKAIDYTGLGCLRIAFCNFMLDNKMEYKKYLLLARNGNLDLDEDSHAKEFSETLFDENLRSNIKSVIKAKNYLENNQPEMVIRLLKTAVDSIENIDWKGKALLYLSESEIELGELNEAFNYASRAISNNYKFEKWILPEAYLMKAKAYYLIKNFNEAKKYLIKARDENDFYYKTKIEAQINNLARKLKIMKY